MTYPCPTCRAENQIVNQCGCDPQNMPTPPAVSLDELRAHESWCPVPRAALRGEGAVCLCRKPEPEPEIKRDEHGKRYIDGKNGKRWYLAPLPYHDAELARSLSVVYYGRPKLNDFEDQIFQLALPILARAYDQAYEKQLDEQTFCPDCGASFQQQRDPDLDAEALAYEIAEDLAEAITRAQPPKGPTP